MKSDHEKLVNTALVARERRLVRCVLYARLNPRRPHRSGAAACALIAVMVLPWAAPRLGATSVPSGSVIWLRLDSPVSTKTSHLHDQVTARVIREVRDGGAIAIPLGALVIGHIDKLIPASTPDDRA